MPHNLNVDRIITGILFVAEQDGIITNDEQAIITSIRDNIDKYFKILEENYEDGVITSDEQHRFYEVRKQILEEALEVAKVDQQITQDEFKLLQALREVIQQLEDEEHY